MPNDICVAATQIGEKFRVASSTVTHFDDASRHFDVSFNWITEQLNGSLQTFGKWDVRYGEY